MKWTSRLVFGVLLWWGASAGARPAILGVFSNEEGEFKTVTLMVHRSGYAYFHAAVMGTIGEWKYDAKRLELTLTCYDPQANREESLKFAFDAREKAYWIMDPETGLRATDSAGRLRRLSDKNPAGAGSGVCGISGESAAGAGRARGARAGAAGA